MKIVCPESMFHMLLWAACVLMTLELTANSHRYCMYSWQLLSLTNGIGHVLFHLLFSPSSRPMHVYSWKDHIILMLEHGKCHLLSMYAFKQSLHKQYINSMESRTVTRERGKPVVNLCAGSDVPAYSLSQNMCVSYTDRSGIHINKQMFRSGLYFIDLSIPLMVIPWYSLLMLASALQTSQKSSQNKNAWQLDLYRLILIYKRHSISFRHENITADRCPRESRHLQASPDSLLHFLSVWLSTPSSAFTQPNQLRANISTILCNYGLCDI